VINTTPLPEGSAVIPIAWKFNKNNKSDDSKVMTLSKEREESQLRLIRVLSLKRKDSPIQLPDVWI